MDTSLDNSATNSDDRIRAILKHEYELTQKFYRRRDREKAAHKKSKTGDSFLDARRDQLLDMEHSVRSNRLWAKYVKA